MRYVTLTALAIATVALVACEQQAPDQNPTSPDAAISFGKQIGGQCDATRARLIGTQQADLWKKPELDQAKTLFALVTANCSTANIGVARSKMLDYVQWSITNRDAIIAQAAGTKEANLLVHWNTVFSYVGYTGDDQPSTVPLSIFTDSGAVKVIDWNEEAEIKPTDGNAALTSFSQDPAGDQRDHLFVIYPIPSGCLTGTNLQQFGPCYQFSAFPKVSPKFSPKVKVGICEVHDLDDNITDFISTPALGHLEPLTRVTDEVPSHYPLTCGDVAGIPAGSWHDGFGGVARRLAWLAKDAVTPKPLYAVHGGLGGLGGGMSPFGAVDRLVFQENFQNATPGAKPDSLAQTGKWMPIQATSPGTILVQASLGTQNSKLAVLSQGGGNCAKCGGLLLQGNLATEGPAATEGIYEVKWSSLQDQSNMKEAVFVLRDTGGRDIARVTYAVRNNVNLILYNDVRNNPGTFLGNWVQHTPATFKIQVNLDTKKTTIWFNGATVATVENAAFVNTQAANFASVSADFRGIDSGTIGWDNITVERLADMNH